MKIIKGVLYTIIILTMLLVGLMVAGHFNPDITKTIAGKLYGSDDENGGKSKGLIRKDKMNVDDILGRSDYDITPDESYPFSYLKYTVPDTGNMSIPDELAGKVGYTEPSLNVVDVDDATADEIESNLGTGPTGDDLDFDSLFYPYYYMLNDSGKHLYRQVVANIHDVNEAFKPVEDYSTSDVKKVCEAVFNDHPELFWINTAYSCKCRGGNKVVELDMNYNQAADNLPDSIQQFNSEAEGVIDAAAGLANNFEKEKYVHDYLANTIEYSKAAPMNQSAYSAIVNKRTVCAGYARAMQYIMQRLGVPCYYCTGYAGENHAWDIIQLDSDFYNVDVTWDDAEPTNYEYFNKSDSNYASTHARKSLSINLPACNGTNYQVDSTVEAQEWEDNISEEEGYDGRESYPEDAEPNDMDVPYEVEEDEQPYGEPQSYGTADDGALDENDWPNVVTTGEIDASAKIENEVNNNSVVRTLNDLGVPDSEVIHNIADYYTNCRKEIAARGKGSYSFQYVLSGEEMALQWEKTYEGDIYKDAYLRSAMSDIGARTCQLNVSCEPLAGGYYLVNHDIDLR